MKKILFGVFALILMSSCNGSANKNKVEVENQTTTTETPVQQATLYGTYEGTLPAADCEGIQTTLTIHDDKTYSLKSEYLGVKDGLFEASGVYNLIDKTLLELITPSSGEKTYYKILNDNSVMLSDEKGTINEGELAEHYILKKK